MTPREERIIGMLLEGTSKKDIAHRFHLTENTIDVILHRIYKKHETKNLIDFIRKQGWLKVSLRTYKFNDMSTLEA